jgi:uncharacterized membrane protein YciS (DUF1049 family)
MKTRWHIYSKNPLSITAAALLTFLFTVGILFGFLLLPSLLANVKSSLKWLKRSRTKKLHQRSENDYAQTP